MWIFKRLCDNIRRKREVKVFYFMYIIKTLYIILCILLIVRSCDIWYSLCNYISKMYPNLCKHKPCYIVIEISKKKKC